MPISHVQSDFCVSLAINDIFMRVTKEARLNLIRMLDRLKILSHACSLTPLAQDYMQLVRSGRVSKL